MDAKEYIDEALSITMHSTLGSSPGSLVFNRDMFLNIPLIADWHAITKRQEHLVNENLMHENRKRRRHDYAIDQQVLKKWYKPTKLGPRTCGLGRSLDSPYPSRTALQAPTLMPTNPGRLPSRSKLPEHTARSTSRYPPSRCITPPRTATHSF
jgi:hypothetical protein